MKLVTMPPRYNCRDDASILIGRAIKTAVNYFTNLPILKCLFYLASDFKCGRHLRLRFPFVRDNPIKCPIKYLSVPVR